MQMRAQFVKVIEVTHLSAKFHTFLFTSLKVDVVNRVADGGDEGNKKTRKNVIKNKECNEARCACVCV